MATIDRISAATHKEWQNKYNVICDKIRFKARNDAKKDTEGTTNRQELRNLMSSAWGAARLAFQENNNSEQIYWTEYGRTLYEMIYGE